MEQIPKDVEQIRRAVEVLASSPVTAPLARKLEQNHGNRRFREIAAWQWLVAAHLVTDEDEDEDEDRKFSERQRTDWDFFCGIARNANEDEREELEEYEPALRRSVPGRPAPPIPEDERPYVLDPELAAKLKALREARTKRSQPAPPPSEERNVFVLSPEQRAKIRALYQSDPGAQP